MINLPVIDDLRVDGYDLYPGLDGTQVNLASGLNLVLGANGIGKTTLVTLIFRLLTGPWDVPAARGLALSRGNLDEKDLGRAGRRYFANRVNDGAIDAEGSLTFHLSDDKFVITRSLRDLGLLRATVRRGRRRPIDISSESDLKHEITTSANIGSFSDWILLLRFVVFSQESRQSLLWDETAQVQILRPLFLSPADSNEWVLQEKAIYALDSRRRNLSASIFSAESYVRREQTKMSSLMDLSNDIDQLELQRSELAEELDQVLADIESAEEARKSSRLAYLVAEEEAESARSSYEIAKSRYIMDAFPSASETARYLISQLASAEICLVCGSDNPDLLNQLTHRINDGQCPACGAQFTADSPDQPDVSDAVLQLESTSERVDTTSLQADEDDRVHRQLLDRARETRQSLGAVEAALADLRVQLPAPEGETAKRLSDLNVFRQQLESMDADLAERRAKFAVFARRMTDEILARADEIKSRFNGYAREFLVENSDLRWSRKSIRVGQSGTGLPFPKFTLEMGGTNFETATVRATSDSVSESQREFIDLSFRMALVDLASANGATFAIDSPDSSLDAVFEEKAALVLSRYASTARKRLIVTSNISSGEFLPELVKQFRRVASSEPEVVDLFQVGTPTAAVRELGRDYSKALRSLYRRAKLS